MKIDILTLFPEAFSALNSSILKRAQESGKLEIKISNIRDFSKDKHSKCDDEPYGGGAGMLMTCQPIYDAVKAVKKRNSHIVFASPSGQKLSPEIAKRLSCEKHLIFICGHYEGVDERVLQLLKPEEISIGDYVLTGGEIPTMVIVDCLSRFVDGVITAESLTEESFSSGSLEYPQYTRPQKFKGLSVPEVLRSGNHAEIAKWRKAQSEKRTRERRAELLK